MDYCSARTQIKSYAPTATGSTLFAKNIDCVTLDADYVGCDTLTVGGVSFTDVPAVINKTRNILDTTSANQTNVVGTLQVPDVETERITGVGGSTIQFKSSTEHSISNSTGGITLYLTNSTLGTAATNYMGLAIGTSKTSSNNAWQMLYYNTTAGSSNNRLEFKMAGQLVPTMSMINGKVGIANSAPTEALDVTGNAKVNGTLTVTGLSTMSNLSVTLSSLSISSTNTKTQSAASGNQNVTLSGISESAKYINLYVYDIGISSNGAIGLRIGTGTTVNSGTIYCGSSAAINYTDINGSTNLHNNGYLVPEMGNGENVTGKVTFEKVSFTGQTTWWYYTGMLKAHSYRAGSTIAISGFITYTGGIGLINLNAAGNFNVAGSYIAAQWY